MTHPVIKDRIACHLHDQIYITVVINMYYNTTNIKMFQACGFWSPYHFNSSDKLVQAIWHFFLVHFWTADKFNNFKLV